MTDYSDISYRIGVMEAYKAGKEIECSYIKGTHKDKWFLSSNPIWNWGRNNYRVKEEPIEVTVLYHPASKRVLNTASPASTEHYVTCGWKLITLIEKSQGGMQP